MNAEGLALLRALIFKLWSSNEARTNGDCQAIADDVNTWMPKGMKVTGYDVDRALRGEQANITVNVSLLRTKIDSLPVLYSARLSGDYQAILNEVAKDVDLKHATLADVVEAMALRIVPSPELIVVGAAKLVGKGATG